MARVSGVDIPSNKRELIDEIKKAKKDVIFHPVDEGDVTFVQGDKIELRLEFGSNEYINYRFEEIFENKNIEIVKEYNYVKLFEIEKMMDESLLEDMMYACPIFPDIRIGHVGLLRRR